MLRNRTLPIVALLAGAVMFGACADDIAGPSGDSITVRAVEEDANGARNLEVELGDNAEVHSPDGKWTEPRRPGTKAQ